MCDIIHVRHTPSVPHTDASSGSFHGSEAGADDVSATETDEGLEMSLKIQGAGLLHPEAELQTEREEHLMSISTRLQSAVEKLLIAITETTSQVRHVTVSGSNQHIRMIM